MSNGSERSRLAEAWRDFPEAMKVDLIVSELDRLHNRITDLHAEMREGFRKIDERTQRLSAIGLTILGGVVTGLILLVVQIAGR